MTDDTTTTAAATAKKKNYQRTDAAILREIIAIDGNTLETIADLLGVHHATPSEWLRNDDMPATAWAACNLLLKCKAAEARADRLNPPEGLVIFKGPQTQLETLLVVAESLKIPAMSIPFN